MIPTPDTCPCDFHTKALTEEEARIALFGPIKGGEEAPPLVLIERFHHLWDARSLALQSAREEGAESVVRAVEEVKNEMVAQYNIGNVKPWNGGGDVILKACSAARSAASRVKKEIEGKE